MRKHTLSREQEARKFENEENKTEWELDSKRKLGYAYWLSKRTNRQGKSEKEKGTENSLYTQTLYTYRQYYFSFC